MKQTINGITYSIYKKYAAVSKLQDEQLTKIHIPDEVNGVPIIRIEARAFKDTNIISISLPFSLEEICKEAFCSCKSLKKIEQRGQMTNRVIEICDLAFYFCTNLRNVKFAKRLVLTCNNKDGSHFGFCRSLNSLSLAEIESCSTFLYTFQNCEQLEDIIFSGACKLQLSIDTFWNCPRLQTLVLNCKVQLSNYTRDILKQVKIVTPAINKNLLDLAYEGYNIELL